MDSRLLTVLRKRNLLRAGEEDLLRQRDVLALTHAEQLAYLKQNRSVGFVVTLFAGGIRVTLIAGGLVALVGFTVAGTFPFSWWMPPIWLALGAFVAWAVHALFRAARSLGATLPDYETLAAEVESKPT